MSVGYQAIGWNRQKRLYDRVLLGAVAAYLVLFVGISLALHDAATAETILIRAFGSAAFVLLHVILAIGPLARMDRRWLPLLYNRRHLGVTMFLLALAHGGFSLVQFHALGVLDPLVSVLVGDGSFTRVATLPFQVFGALALVVLFLMAATSHDFWLVNLSAPVWKALHLLVYAAYGLLVAHVAFGVGQMAGGGWLLAGTAAGAAGLVTLHVLAARRERRVDAGGPVADAAAGGWVEVCGVDEIADTRARIANCGGERVAIFRYDGKLSAVSNVCQHQNGPLGEGRVIDGCITCPWHGYQYRPETGSSPPPFTEKVCTFRVEARGGRVWLDPRPLPPGTRVEPANVGATSSS